ncbi:hypothetical protein [Streptomyces sp. CAU 1734]|uniref:hypothetical protein n=1 Tax=Streptomyces sp. CAU 1734 TaxID=3140360 RepID=UPI0032617494
MTDATPADLLTEAARRAAALGWRTIAVSRLTRLQRGDATALPPDPATALDARQSRPTRETP